MISSVESPAPDYLNLAEVKLFNRQGQQITPDAVIASSTLAHSEYGYHPPELCADNRVTTFCHTALEDADPMLMLAYHCTEGLSRVTVVNRRGSPMEQERIASFKLSVLGSSGEALWPSYMFETAQPQYDISEPKQPPSSAGSRIPPKAQELQPVVTIVCSCIGGVAALAGFACA